MKNSLSCLLRKWRQSTKITRFSSSNRGLNKCRMTTLTRQTKRNINKIRNNIIRKMWNLKIHSNTIVSTRNQCWPLRKTTYNFQIDKYSKLLLKSNLRLETKGSSNHLFLTMILLALTKIAVGELTIKKNNEQFRRSHQ